MGTRNDTETLRSEVTFTLDGECTENSSFPTRRYMYLKFEYLVAAFSKGVGENDALKTGVTTAVCFSQLIRHVKNAIAK